MAAVVDDTEVLATLATALAGVSLRLVDESGAVVRLIGDADKTRIEGVGDAVTARAPAGRVALVRAIGGAHTAVFSYAGERDAELRPFLLALVEVLRARHRVEQDMDSMDTSAAALLEELSMYDTLPKLATGQSEQEIAEMGLKALVVAAGVERALYLRRQHDQCEILVQVCMDDSGFRAVPVPYAGRPVIAEDQGSVWRALRSDKASAFEEVPAGGRLGAEGSPEALARCQVITIPVRYGDGPQRETLGALMVMDKRGNSYAHRTELGSHEIKLATSIAAMLGSVLGTRKGAELDKELKTAKQIQSQILPDRPARAHGLDFAGRAISCGVSAGGDYFDYLKMSDDRVLVVVADVSGHDLASGMIMVSARATLKALAKRHASVGRVFDDFAATLFDDLARTERFITAVGAMISPRDRSLEIVNAGHNDSMIYRAATGQVQRIPSADTVLGFLPVTRHEVCREVLHDGDVLLLYTDGVTEATAPDGTMLGERRLERLLAAAAGGSATEILEAVLGAVDEFVDRSGDSDDITAVVIKAVRVDGEEP